MDGVAVAIGSESSPTTCIHLHDLNPMPRILDIIVHWCLRAFRSCSGKGSPVTVPPYLGIMVTYSDGDVDLAIQSLLVQFYPVLLSTLLSVRRQQLSLFDADFALLLGSSPLAMYLSFASVCDLCGIRTGLFKRIKSYRRTIRIIGALTPLLWIALSMIASFSNEAFLDSPCNPTLNFLAWLWTAFSPLLSVGRGNPPAVGLGALIPFFILLFRRRSQVWADVKLSLDEASRLRILFTWVKCAWYVPILAGPRLAKANARKVHYRPSTQVVCSSFLRVH